MYDLTAVDLGYCPHINFTYENSDGYNNPAMKKQSLPEGGCMPMDIARLCHSH